MEYLNHCPVCSGSIFVPFLTCHDHLVTGDAFNIIQCTSCGLRFTNPRPVSSELGKYYRSEEYISHTDSKKGLFNKIYQTIRKFAIQRKCKLIQSFKPSGSILDIGCATGDFLLYMKMQGWETTGIEPDESARRKAVERGLQVFDESKLNAMKAGSMDVITLWHVLEHVSDLKQRMNEITRLLKKDGILIVAVPNNNSADALKYGTYWAGYDVPRHLYHFTRASMQKLFSETNFRLISIRPMKWDSFYVSLLSEKNTKGKISWLHGIWNGFNSNRVANNNGEYSSLIYVAKSDDAK